MQPPSKLRGHHGQAADMLDPAAEVADARVTVPEADSDSEYENVPKKAKNTTQAPAVPQKTSAQVEQNPTQPNLAADDMPTDDAGAGTDAAPQDTTMSDADWLRSRTSRLLGLAEEEESPAPQPAEIDSDSEEVVVEQKVRHEHNNKSASDDQAQQVEKPDVDETEEKIRASLRLYLRNLSYNVSEDDLRTAFASFGNLEEVRPSFSFNVLYSFS